MTATSEEYFTIAQAAALIAARKLSPVELVDHCLARIERIDPVLHSFIAVTEEAARDEARTAEWEIVAHGPRGALHGIPIGLKDLFNTRGVRTTAHSAVLENNIPVDDATVVSCLRQAGAISLGKLAMLEFAIGGEPAETIWPEAQNPWQRGKWPGGSSSGTGAAVAAGLVLGGTGSDTGGSIRTPSALCGLAGLKPTYGLVSRAGMLPLAFSLDHAGPMAWTAEDCAILLQAMAGHDDADPASARRAAPDYVAAISGGIKGSRIGVLRQFHELEAPVSPAILAAIEDAIRVFQSLGADVREIALPPMTDWAACGSVILYAEAYAVHEYGLQNYPEKYGDVFRARVTQGTFFTASDYIHALRRRRELVTAMTRAMREVDILLTATLSVDAIDANLIPKIIPLDQPSFAMPFNLTGQPAMSICAGYSKTGMPLAIQLAARPFEEALLLRIAHAYEAACPWPRRRPADI